MNQFKNVLKWIFGILFLLSGLGFLTQSVLIGILYIALGLFILPPSFEFFESKAGIKLPSWSKWLTVIVGIIAIGSLINTTDLGVDSLPTATNTVKQSPQNTTSNESKKEEKSSQEKALEARKKRINNQFSAWDGSHRNLEKIIKQSMNDPDSYEHIETRYEDVLTHLLVATKFRGNNAFGGKVVNTVTAKVDLDGNVLEIIEQ